MPDMKEALLPILDEIGALSRLIKSHRTIILLFNFEELDTLQQSTGKEYFPYLAWIGEKSGLFPGIIGRAPKSFFQKRPVFENLIIAGSMGCEIESPSFSWNFPGLELLRHRLREFYRLMQMEFGPLWMRENSILSEIDLRINLEQLDDRHIQKMRHFILESLSGSLFSASRVEHYLYILPVHKWDKGQALEKLLHLFPVPDGYFPSILYFGAEYSDEPAFQKGNLYGYSVLIRGNITRQTSAKYYLRHPEELTKLLLWLNSI